jgi:hypothetical protein
MSTDDDNNEERESGVDAFVQATLRRIRAEYLEMPGMRLTVQQVERLFGIERPLCNAVLDALVDADFLCVNPNGTYARLSDGEIPRPHPAKADLSVKKRVTPAA